MAEFSGRKPEPPGAGRGHSEETRHSLYKGAALCQAPARPRATRHRPALTSPGNGPPGSVQQVRQPRPLAPTLTSTHLLYFLPLTGRTRTSSPPRMPTEMPSTEEEQGYQGLLGEGGGVWGQDGTPQSQLTKRTGGSQSPAPSAGPALTVARQTLSFQLNPPYGSFPVRKWANCYISPPIWGDRWTRGGDWTGG